MIDDLFHDTRLRKSQIMMLLDISESTFYRWQSQKWIPRQAELILRSVAQGLPVMMTRSHWWDGHRFAVDGSLRLPNDYPIYPVDLWTFYWLNINGRIRPAAQEFGLDVACVP